MYVFFHVDRIHIFFQVGSAHKLFLYSEMEKAKNNLIECLQLEVRKCVSSLVADGVEYPYCLYSSLAPRPFPVHKLSQGLGNKVMCAGRRVER